MYRRGKDIRTVAEIDALPIERESVVETISLPDYVHRHRSLGLTYTGYIDVPKDGVYTFFVKSADASQLKIGDQVVVEHDEPHAFRERSGQIALKAGLHSITVLYAELTRWEGIEAHYAVDGSPRKKISKELLFH